MRIRVVTAAALLAAAAGCGESGPTLVPVTGTVTLNGKPLDGALVAFVPDPSNKDGLPGQDVSGSDGKYTAKTHNLPGLVVGKYQVTVTKTAGAAAVAADGDPFMARLGAESAKHAYLPGTASKKKGAEPDPVEGTFVREVKPGGVVLDLDLQASTAAPRRMTPGK